MSKKLCLLIGTKKCGSIISSELIRKTWKLQGPFLKGAKVNNMNAVIA
ncbi:MAG: hypothetical protein AABZ41_03140 [Bacteroidota bacterium]